MGTRRIYATVGLPAALVCLLALSQPLIAAKPDKKAAPGAPPTTAVAETQPCCPMCGQCVANGARQASAVLPPSTPSAAAAAKAPATRPAAAPGPGYGRGMGGPGAGMGGPGNMREVMGVFHQLLTDHAQIQREVKDVENGVVTVTTSKNPVVMALIRTHVAQMKSRLEKGQPVRRWDPLFVEIFRNADKIDMKIDEVEGGVRVTETSQDPHVVLLIRQHAREGVSQFVAKGWDQAHQATPIPEGYGTAKPAAPTKPGSN